MNRAYRPTDPAIRDLLDRSESLKQRSQSVQGEAVPMARRVADVLKAATPTALFEHDEPSSE